MIWLRALWLEVLLSLLNCLIRAEIIPALLFKHVKLSHHDILIFFIMLLMVNFGIKMLYKTMENVICNILRSTSQHIERTFNKHYSYLFSGARKRERLYKNRSKCSSNAYHLKGTRKVRKRGYKPSILTLILLATRAQAQQGSSNEVQHNKISSCTESMNIKRHREFNVIDEWYDNEFVVQHVTDEDDDNLIAFSAKGRKAAPHACKFDTDSYAIGVDTYASRCISPFIVDFVKGSLRPVGSNKKVKPFGKGVGLNIPMMGTLKWKFQDDTGRTHVFLIDDSLLVPDGTMRLLSPQHMATSCTTARFDFELFSSTQYWNRNVLRWGENGEFVKTVYNTRTSNVPTFYTAPRNEKFVSFMSEFNEQTASLDEHIVYSGTTEHATDDLDLRVNEQLEQEPHDDEDSQEQPMVWIGNQGIPPEDEPNLTATTDTAEFMRWHYRLGHMHFKKMKRLATLGFLPKRFAKQEIACKCKVCQFGKQVRSNSRVKGSKAKIFQSTYPGQCVSVDQLVSSTEGFYAQLKGRLTRKRYKYATVFVDQYSRFTYVSLQQTLSSAETIRAKEDFEAKCREYGVSVEHYHADNGRFADNAFREHVNNSEQTLTFCGVNAHWQNGVAEKAIRDLKESARTMLLHAIDRWPGAITTYLWPQALRHAATLRNNAPFKHEDRSPLELFTSSEIQPNLKHLHTFGCPVYVLNANLQALKSVSPWLPRSRIGIYLGQSEHHARSVSLVMSLTTGLVSPQFHVNHDDFFESISSSERNVDQRTWMVLSGLKQGHISSVDTTRKGVEKRNDNISNEVRNNNMQDSTTMDVETQDIEINNEEIASEPDEVPTTQALGIGHRIKELSQQRQESLRQRADNIVSYQALEEEMEYYLTEHARECKDQSLMSDPIAYKASTNPDVMYYHEAMKAPDSKQFTQALINEVNAHIEGEHWEMIPKKSVPEGEVILDSVWAMRRKRDIKTREVYKHKARLNMHGGQQVKGIHYDETYSPVVQWSSVRIALILTILQGWASRQIDFVLAFPQADITHDNYMRLPKGVKTIYGDGKSHVLKIKKNLYGGKNAGKIWYDHLCEALTNIGFVKSEADNCVFYRRGVIFMFYVDDGLFFAKDNKDIDKAIRDLRNARKAKRKLILEDQGDIKDYLGINFERTPDGKVKLTQPQIIDDILEELGIDEHWTAKQVAASSSKILHRDKSAKEAKFEFNYRKVIGKLNFLEKCTRPDIAYAVHQCARFCEDPRESHVEALMYLGRYLKGTRNQGIILDPDVTQSLAVWADADFSGNWVRKTAELDPSTAKSRSGFMIMLSGCPVTWSSKLQTQIALSSCEAEYICLSQALREAIPMMTLVQELKDRDFLDQFSPPKVHCKAFEDNSGCVEMATVHKMRPRTKHINITYHHFREAVRNKLVTIHQVRTTEQLADIFTKPLAQNLFVKFRKRIMGW